MKLSAPAEFRGEAKIIPSLSVTTDQFSGHLKLTLPTEYMPLTVLTLIKLLELSLKLWEDPLTNIHPEDKTTRIRIPNIIQIYLPDSCNKTT